MATVDRVTGPSVGVAATPIAYQDSRLDPRYADGIAEGIRGVGGAVLQIAQQEQDKADTAAVLEAQRKLGDWERTWFDPKNERGVYAKKGRDALGLVDEIAPDFDRVQNELAGNLRNPAAREAFARFATSKREGVLDRVNGYAVREHDGYVAAEFQASVANSVESAATAALEGRYQDQAREVQLGLQSLRAQAAALGEPPEATAVKERAFLSTVHATAVNGLLARGQIDAAAAYFDANAEDVSAEMAGQLQARMRPLLIDAAANTILDGQDAAGITPEAIGATTTVDAVWPHLVRQESGGKQAATSIKGAMGVAQIMPDTGPVAAKLAGLPWDPERCRTDPAYNAALGRAYLTAQLETFGSMPMALAAYNAGPGAVQKWITRFGDPRKGEISLADWCARIPYKETREYVKSITEAAGGSPAVAEGVAASGELAAGGGLSAQLAAARRYADPALRAAVEQGIRSRHAVREQDRQDQERETRRAVFGAVETMDPRASLAKTLPPDQYAYAAQNGLLSTLEARLRERIAGTDPVTPPDVLASLQRIFYDAAQGTSEGRRSIARAEVAKMDVLNLPLSPKDREWAEQTRAALMKPQADSKAVNFASEAQILDATRARLKIPAGQRGDAKWGPFLVQYLDAKRQATKDAGRELNAEEQQAIIDRLTVPFVRETFFGGTESVPAYRAGAADIPEDVRQKLVAAGRKLTGREPTEAELVRGYTTYLQTQGGR